MEFTTMADSISDPDLFAILLSELFFPAVTSADFEIVDESTLEMTTGPVAHGTRVDPNNAYVTPDHFVTVIATNGSDESASMPVILQPVTVGTDHEVGYSFLAGTPQFQLNVWAQGASNKAVTCTMNPTLGSLTSDCKYTPPANTTNGTARDTTTVTVTAAADTNITMKFPIYVYPADGIREHLWAGPSGASYIFGPDSNGKYWYPQRASYWKRWGHASCDDNYTWPPITDIERYKYCGYSLAEDELFKFVVPNGTYQITLLTGSPTARASNMYFWGYDTQGTIYTGSGAVNGTYAASGAASFLGVSPGKFVDICNLGSACVGLTPGTDIVLTATVTDNNLYFATRGNTINGSILNAFSIVQTGGLQTTTHRGVSISRTPATARR